MLSQVQPGEIRAACRAAPPEQGEPFDAILDDVEPLILPGITHWQSPNFFAYFPANTSGPAILGDLLSAGLGVQGMLWATSPACTELETHVLDWLVDMLGLPEQVQVQQRRRRRDPGHGLAAPCCPRCWPARERATGFAEQRARLRRPAGGLHLDARPTPRSKRRSRSPGWAARTCG